METRYLNTPSRWFTSNIISKGDAAGRGMRRPRRMQILLPKTAPLQGHTQTQPPFCTRLAAAPDDDARLLCALRPFIVFVFFRLPLVFVFCSKMGAVRGLTLFAAVATAAAFGKGDTLSVLGASFWV